MKKNNLSLLCLISLMLLGCGTQNPSSNFESSSNDDISSEPVSITESNSIEESSSLDPNDPSTYDFGNPESWAGEQISTIDLGDCIIDAYSYDERYDWGQSIMKDDDGLYKMWWCRHSRYDSIWYAESYDLKNWFNATKVLVVIENTTWIKMHVGKPTVVKIDGEYRMYFEAPATLKDYGSKEFDNNVFLATSNDGKQWSIWTNGGDEPYPVLRMSDDEMAASWEFANSNTSGYGYYGLGQPSVCYVNGLYYLYYTHTLSDGDRMYVTTSRDGIHFERGEQAFLRAGSGVKYNDLTEKFYMAYEKSTGETSNVYFMESTDGVHFTYSDYVSAAENKNILSRNHFNVHGYPDFVCNTEGHLTDYTCYAAYMEGRMADTGSDWRQYASTWDIHIVAFNPPEFANRTMVLPNNRVYNSETIEPYKKEHVPYEDLSVGISKTGTAPVLDGTRDEIYGTHTVLDVSRTVCENCAIPGEVRAAINVTYDSEYLYMFVEVEDSTVDDSDYLYILIDEKKYATNAAEISNIEAYRENISFSTGEAIGLDNVEARYKQTFHGYILEIKYKWRFKTTQTAYDEIGFDCYVYDNKDSREFSSVKAWNDFKVRFNITKAGSLYFRKS